jgi:hypothetical protein
MQYSGGSGKVICYECGKEILCKSADQLLDVLDSTEFKFLHPWEKELILSVYQVREREAV